MKHIKRITENFWHDTFGKPTVDDATHDSLRGQGWSQREKDDTGDHYVVFKGQKFSQDQIEYDDPNSTEEIPRIENGILIIANPAWNL